MKPGPASPSSIRGPSDDMMRLCAERGIALNPDRAAAGPEVLVLAIKPQMLDDAAAAR